MFVVREARRVQYDCDDDDIIWKRKLAYFFFFFFIDVLTVYKGYLIKIDNLLEIHNNRKYKVFPDVGKN